MRINRKNLARIETLFHFCHLYTAHRDFKLAETIAKHNPLTWKQAESVSDLCNLIVKTKEAKPQDFIVEEDESANTAIDKYLKLKFALKETRREIGTERKNELYKAVKIFYRKRLFSYQMDTYFTFTINGLQRCIWGQISYYEFMINYCYERNLFTGEKSPISLKQSIRIANKIFEIIENNGKKSNTSPDSPNA